IFVKHMTAYEFFTLLEFRRVLFRSVPLQIGIALLERGPSAPLRELGDQRPDPLRRRRDRHRAAERVTAHRLLPCGLGPLPARLRSAGRSGGTSGIYVLVSWTGVTDN